MRKSTFLKKRKSLFLLITVAILGFAFFYLSSGKELLERNSLEKQELTETLVVDYDELYWIERNQRELAGKMKSDEDRKWLSEEIQEATVKLRYTLDFMVDHQEYDQIEVELPVTKYVDGDDVIEFYSDEGVITRVHSESGWKDFKNNS